MTVGLLDTGVRTGTPQLAGRVVDGPRLLPAAPAGQDCVGHGTFIASLISGAAGKGFTGLAPATRLYALAVTDAAGNTAPDVIAAGINRAVAAGARIVLVSVVTPQPAAVLRAAVQRAIAAGALVVAPAMADGQTQQAPVYPAAYPGVLAVAASGKDSTMPAGPAQGAPVDLVAPGDSVVGPGVSGGDFTGTGASYAAAYVAATAALIDSYRGAMSPEALTHRLETTAVHPGTRMPDPGAGYGLVDPYAAMTTLLPEEGDGLVPSATPPFSVRKHALTVPPPPRTTSQTAGLAVGAAGLVLVALVAVSAVVLPRGRRRNWRPGT
ncbi:S8 family serine peptidase [Actinacidiphila guanduensis]|uniref:S8 family serine peptidase n=1 Tax=Actinacidiphila guanduensis TaxID=310781 RepID=UPI0015A327FA|nr:S8 family serine peptidase [Actinacidiphila guanduensis]